MQPQLGGSWLLLSAILVLTCTPVVQYAQAYCWEPGKNPSFTGPPVVEQVDIRQVRVSWFGLVSQRNCADQFLVKYWQKTSPQDYKTTDLVPNDTDFILIQVTPKVDYQFQAVAREDKGIIGGIDWNKSPITDFKTSQYNSEVNPTPTNEETKSEPRKTDSYNNNNNHKIDQPKMDKNEDVEGAVGLSIELIVIIAVCGVVLLLIVFGIVYKVACAKKSDDDDDDDDDDFEENREKEKLEV